MSLEHCVGQLPPQVADYMPQGRFEPAEAFISISSSPVDSPVGNNLTRQDWPSGRWNAGYERAKARTRHMAETGCRLAAIGDRIRGPRVMASTRRQCASACRLPRVPRSPTD